MSAAEESAQSMEPVEAAPGTKTEEKLPPLSKSEFALYNKLAEGMSYCRLPSPATRFMHSS